MRSRVSVLDSISDFVEKAAEIPYSPPPTPPLPPSPPSSSPSLLQVRTQLSSDRNGWESSFWSCRSPELPETNCHSHSPLALCYNCPRERVRACGGLHPQRLLYWRLSVWPMVLGKVIGPFGLGVESKRRKLGRQEHVPEDIGTRSIFCIFLHCFLPLAPTQVTVSVTHAPS